MAKVLVCDICGQPCQSNGRYKVEYISFLGFKKHDICNSCMDEIKRTIKESKKYGNSK